MGSCYFEPCILLEPHKNAQKNVCVLVIFQHKKVGGICPRMWYRSVCVRVCVFFNRVFFNHVFVLL